MYVISTSISELPVSGAELQLGLKPWDIGVRTDARNEERLMNSSYWKNFLDMPVVLKLIVGSSLVFPLFIVESIFPDSSVNVFGQLVPIEAWWANGGGPSTAIVGLAMCAASWLMLRRAARARLVYAIGCILMIISIPVVGVGFNLTRHDIFVSMTLNSVTMSVLVAYLYLSRAVREYFGNPTRP